MNLMPYIVLTIMVIVIGVVIFIVLKKKITIMGQNPHEYSMIVVFVAIFIMLVPFSWEEYKADDTTLLWKGIMTIEQTFQNALRAFLLDGPWSEWRSVKDISDVPLYSVIGILLCTIAPLMTFERLISMLKSRHLSLNEFRHTYNDNPYYSVKEDMISTLEDANNGNPDAMYAVANMYFYGLSADRDFRKAKYWFEKLKSFSTDYVDSVTEEYKNKIKYYKMYAYKYLSHMYYAGMVSEQSYEMSYKYAAESVKYGDLVKGHLAFLKSVGSGCEFDFGEVEKLYKEADKNGDISLKVRLANFYEKYGRFNDVAKVYNEIYNGTEDTKTENDPENSVHSLAAFEIGRLYKNGLITDKNVPDYKEAEKWFIRAIENKNRDSNVYLELGKMYFNPSGDFQKNFKYAQQYFIEASEGSNIEACYILGYMYQYGHVEYSLRKAVKYHKKAADKGHVGSMVALANIYQQKECCDYSLAYKYAKMAAKSGHSEGCFIYGNLLFLGRGCKADMDEAYIQYIYAKEHGCTQADFMLERLKNVRNQN